MGGNMSIQQSDNQEIKNSISQVSTERCTVAFTSTQNINLTLSGGSISDSSFENSVLANDSSCALKASLSTSIINSLKNQQGASQFDVPGLFTMLTALTGGGNDSISQNNSQLIANEASQLMNSLCQDNSTSTQNVNIIASNEIIENVKFGNYVKSNKFDCILDNSAAFYAQNDESNTQQASQTRIDGMIFLAIIIAVAVIAVAAIKYGFKKRQLASKDTSGEALKAVLDEPIDVDEAPPPYSKKPPPPSPVLSRGKPPVIYNRAFNIKN